MTPVLTFWVPGHPKTKGSLDLNPGPKCRCTPDCPGYAGRPTVRDTAGSSRWRKLVAYQAEQAMRFVPRAWPLPRDVRVGVRLGFLLDTDDVIANGAGDLDKLYRNVLDALTDAQVYVDDVQVVELGGGKIEMSTPDWVGASPGVRITVLV